ncbi:MAG: hypothetical protein Q8P23_00800 [bacterium]|nr:hypothetical protein [bacterium]
MPVAKRAGEIAKSIVLLAVEIADLVWDGVEITVHKSTEILNFAVDKIGEGLDELREKAG